MSIITMAAYFVDRVLLIKILNVVTSAVEVATSSELYSLSPPTVSLTRSFSFFVRFVITNYLAVRYFSVFWDVWKFHKETCVCSWDVADALKKAASCQNPASKVI
jgi:hypothetical protein